ncbi:hypothetical protein [Putridiphycobacter roseus]|nr:hypothetical protein [Putridiphycobacter roseus]
MNYTEELNTNIYDSIYSGEKWFHFENIYSYKKDSELVVNFKFRIEEDLLPWAVKWLNVNIDLLGSPSQKSYTYTTFIYSMIDPEIGKTFCFTISIRTIDQNGDVILIHPYEECITYN